MFENHEILVVTSSSNSVGTVISDLDGLLEDLMLIETETYNQIPMCCYETQQTYFYRFISEAMKELCAESAVDAL